jgi:hypothetical protein
MSWELIGCGPRSGCVGCPPTREEQRLYFFSCEEVAAAAERGGVRAEGAAAGGWEIGAQGQLGQMTVAAPFPGVGMVDSLMPQWDKAGRDWPRAVESSFRRRLVYFICDSPYPNSHT